MKLLDDITDSVEPSLNKPQGLVMQEEAMGLQRVGHD